MALRARPGYSSEALPTLPPVSAAPNLLYYGDNLFVLSEHVKDETVDLVYLDPPFNSNADYNVLFAEHGVKAEAQIHAFEDTWEWTPDSQMAFYETVSDGGPVAEALLAFAKLVPNSDMLAYLAMMAPRLVQLHRVLKPTGSLYLHCDPVASHYLKILLDAVFGPENFRSEITWQRTNVHSDAKRWSPVADTLLYYGKTNRVTWNPQYMPHSEEHLKSKYRDKDEKGRYTLSDMTSPSPRPNMMYEWKGHASPPLGWRYSKETMAKLDAEGRIWYPDSKDKRPRLKRYLDEMPGVLAGNVWTDIPPINSQAKERLGYPTQKPEALLERIIRASSNEGDLVLDPFCGCGTAVAVAQRLNRRWIGIDVTHLAIGLIKTRLQDAYGEQVKDTYRVIGEPTDLEGAMRLAADDPWQFQAWALDLVGARTATSAKKGADGGIDGRLFFEDEKGVFKQIIISVKAGKTGSQHVDQLRGVVEKEGAVIGALISMQEPTKPMRDNAASAGIYTSPTWNTSYPRVQLLPIADLLAGKVRLEYPHVTGVTFKKAPKAEPDQPGDEPLPGFE